MNLNYCIVNKSNSFDGEVNDVVIVVTTISYVTEGINKQLQDLLKWNKTYECFLPSKFLINPDFSYEQRDTRRLNTLKQKVLNHITSHLSKKPFKLCSKGPLGCNQADLNKKILILSCSTVKAGNFGQKIQKLPDKNSKNQ